MEWFERSMLGLSKQSFPELPARTDRPSIHRLINRSIDLSIVVAASAHEGSRIRSLPVEGGRRKVHAGTFTGPPFPKQVLPYLFELEWIENAFKAFQRPLPHHTSVCFLQVHHQVVVVIVPSPRRFGNIDHPASPFVDEKGGRSAHPDSQTRGGNVHCEWYTGWSTGYGQDNFVERLFPLIHEPTSVVKAKARRSRLWRRRRRRQATVKHFLLHRRRDSSSDGSGRSSHLGRSIIVRWHGGKMHCSGRIPTATSGKTRSNSFLACFLVAGNLMEWFGGVPTLKCLNTTTTLFSGKIHISFFRYSRRFFASFYQNSLNFGVMHCIGGSTDLNSLAR